MGIKISDLPNINLPYNGSEEFPIVQGGVTKAAPLSTISNFLSAVLLADSELAVLSGVWQASYTSLTATSGNWNRGYTAFTFLTATSSAYAAAHTRVTTSSASWIAAHTKMTTSSAAYDATVSKVTASSGAYDATVSKVTASSGAYDATQTKMTTSSAAYDATVSKVTASSGAYDATQSRVTTSSASWIAAHTKMTTSSAAYDATVSKVTASSGAYDNVQSVFSTNSGTYATREHVHNGFFPLSGSATVTGPARFNSDITVLGSLSVAGSASFVNTLFSTSSALSVVGNLNTGPVLYVGANGSGDIASFYDTDTGKEILHIGGDNGTFPNVGVKTSTPNVDFTVSGDISARSIIYDRAGDSVEWNTAYTVANASSASWIAATTKITASSGAYDATQTKMTTSSAAYDATQTKMTTSSAAYDATQTKMTTSSAAYDNVQSKFTTSSAAYDNVQSKFTTSSAAYDNAQTIISTTSATWNQLNTNMAGSSALWTDTYTKFSQSSASGASGTTKITASSGAYDATVSKFTTSSAAYDATQTKMTTSSAAYDATVSKVTASSGAYDAMVSKFTTSSAAYDNVQSVFSTNSALYILSGGNTPNSILVIGTTNNQHLEFEANNTPAMTILSTGNIVMGTGGAAYSPLLSANTSKLAVSGDVTVYGTITALSGLGIGMAPAFSYGIAVSGGGQNKPARVRVQSDTNRLVDMTSNSNDTNGVFSQGAAFRVGTSDSQEFAIFVNNASMCRFSTNGFLGIGPAGGVAPPQTYTNYFGTTRQRLGLTGSLSANGEIHGSDSLFVGFTGLPFTGHTNKVTVNGSISSNGTFTGTNLVYNTSNQTIGGDKTFSGQLEATGQVATADTSIMTRLATDTRFGTPYFLSLTDGVSANSTLFTSGVQTITLPAGVYQYESMVLASTNSTTAGANYVLSASRDDTRITSTTQRVICDVKNSQGTSTTLPLYSSQLFNTALSGSFDSTKRQGSLVSHGVVVFGTSTTITPRIAQLITTDASNPAVLEAGSYISFFKRG